MARDIKVIVAEAELQGSDGEYDDSCDHYASLNHKVYSLDEIIGESWFIDLLKEKGFYSKDELGEPTQHLNKFVYEFGSGNYKYWTKNIKEISEYHDIVGVYQEVIGVERNKEFTKWQTNRQTYLKKQAEILKKDLAKKELAKAKAKERQIAKAKKLLEEEGVDVISK